MKKIILVGVVFVSVSILLAIFLFTREKEIIEDPLPTPNVNPMTSPSENDPSTSSLVASRSGSNEINVRNFLSDAGVEKYDEFTQLIARENSVEGIPWYEIFYFEKDRAITVSLQTTPLSIARALAEKELISRLGVFENQLCNLDIRVTVPVSVDSQMSGRDLGLSMCTGSTSL